MHPRRTLTGILPLPGRTPRVEPRPARGRASLPERVARSASLALVLGAALLFLSRDRLVGFTTCVPGTPLVVSGVNPFSDLSADERAVALAHETRHAEQVRATGCAAVMRLRLFGTAEQRAMPEIDAGCAELAVSLPGHPPRAVAESLLVHGYVAEYGSMRRLGFPRTLALLRRHCAAPRVATR